MVIWEFSEKKNPMALFIFLEERIIIISVWPIAKDSVLMKVKVSSIIERWSNIEPMKVRRS